MGIKIFQAPKTMITVFLLPILFFMFSCKKSPVEPAPEQGKYITEPGTPQGVAVTKKIGVTGGNISSSDGRIKITVPAGALDAETTLTIQPISNKMEQGIGKAYRLGPHSITFNKPVSITFQYADGEINGTTAELLRIAYQDSTGAWRMPTGTSLDKHSKSVTVTTTHFSDWGIFPMMFIEPAEARVALNESVNLQVMVCLSADDIEEAEEPHRNDRTVLKPVPAPAFFVKKWIFSGSGKLTSDGIKATYKAPNQQPDPNPEAVTVEVDMKTKGKFLLVSNITVLSDFHIDYLQVDETEMNQPQSSYESRLLIYGNFGPDPGEGKRSVNLNGSRVSVIFWTPKLIVCDIPASGPNSSGVVMVVANNQVSSKLLNEWIVKLKFQKVESPDSSLSKRADFHIRLRGDAVGFPEEGLSAIVPNTDINYDSKAVINMPKGSFTTNVAGDGCGLYQVKWDAITNHQVNRGLYSKGNNLLRGRIVHTRNGFKIKLKFQSENILKSTQTHTPCVGNVQSRIVQDNISLAGYEEMEFELRYRMSGSRTTILAGDLPRLERSGAASGLYWDAQDVKPDQFSTWMKWDEVMPKYD